MTNGLMPHCLLTEGSLISQLKEKTNVACHSFTVVADLQDVILLYMDAMVENDGLSLNPHWMQDNEEFNNNNSDDHLMDYLTGNADE